jgi:hypothetical protein
LVKADVSAVAAVGEGGSALLKGYESFLGWGQPMPREAEIPVILKLYDLTVWTLNHTAKFARHHRYSLGTRIEQTLFDLMDTLCEAKYTSSKAPLLSQANMYLDRLRLQMRMAKDLRLLPLNSYEFQAKAVDEIGRMIGGWRRSRGGEGIQP